MPAAGVPIEAPNPGVQATSLLRSAIVIDHTTQASLRSAAAVDIAPGEARDLPSAPIDGRWANGIVFQQISCSDGAVLDPCAANNTGVLNTANRGVNRPYQPFVVDAYDKCSTFGWQAADYEAKARQLIALREAKAVEKEFWTGALMPANPHLADGANAAGFGAPVNVGTALSPHNGLAQLCQAIADYNGGQGMIHVRPRLLQMLAGQAYLRWENGQWFTATGVKVVAGHGYPGTGPTGQAVTNVSGAITEWAFATELVEVHRGPVEVFAAALTAETIDHVNNNSVVRAKRLYAPIWNGCVLAAASITTTAADT